MRPISEQTDEVPIHSKKKPGRDRFSAGGCGNQATVVGTGEAGFVQSFETRRRNELRCADGAVGIDLQADDTGTLLADSPGFNGIVVLTDAQRVVGSSFAGVLD